LNHDQKSAETVILQLEQSSGDKTKVQYLKQLEVWQVCGSFNADRKDKRLDYDSKGTRIEESLNKQSFQWFCGFLDTYKTMSSCNNLCRDAFLGKNMVEDIQRWTDDLNKP
jgi:YD repeat-containing protein